MTANIFDASIEEVKAYWDARPCNIRHSKSEFGTKQYFDEVERRKYFVESHIPNFAEFEKWKGKKVLEIGCGIGTDTINFARAGAYVSATDISSKSIDIAKKRAKLYGLNITFFNGDVEELSRLVPIEKYDLIYSFGVIHHTPHPENVIEEIKKYMGPESVLKLMVYNRNSYKVLWILFAFAKLRFWELDKWIAKYSEAQTGCPITYTYTKKSIKKLLKGFKIRKIQVEHIFPYHIPDYVNYRYVKEWYFRYMPGFIFKWLERRLGWHLCVEAKLSNCDEEG